LTSIKYNDVKSQLENQEKNIGPILSRNVSNTFISYSDISKSDTKQTESDHV
jgi:hypothetical protein